MAKKLNLPLFEEKEPKKGDSRRPSASAARERLGGRADPVDVGPHVPGRLVAIALPSGKRKPAVVLWCGEREVHVLLDPVRLRRLLPSSVASFEEDPGEILSKIAADAHLFGLACEGDPVRYADESGVLRDGRLVEKCRWGALVLREDGVIVAVGFRKLWPAKASGDA